MLSDPTRLSRIDLFLAATMRPSPDLVARLSEHKIGAKLLEQERALADDARIGDPRATTVDLVIVHFGVPTRAYPDRLIYDLTLWPAHRFEWRLSDWGAAGFDGFRLKSKPDLPLWLPLDPDAVSSVFRPFLHTSHDVEQLFGQPVLDLSWGQIGEWYFGPTPTGEEISFEFDYGLLRAISVQRGIIESHGGSVDQ